MTHLLLILVSIASIVSCSGMQKKLDCRLSVDESQVKKEMLARLNELFPKYQSAALADIGLSFDNSGTAYYPGTVKSNAGSMYSVIYSYAPASECKKLAYQFIQLSPQSN